METIWGRALPILREQVGERNFATWIEPIRTREDVEGQIVLEVPNKFFHEWIVKHFQRNIHDALTRVAGSPLELQIEVSAAAAPPRTAKGPLPASPRATPKPAKATVVGHLVPWYTFDTFVVGDSNRVAHGAALAVAQQPGRQFNPFFLHGGVGLGKTHLINAIGSEFLSRAPRHRIACLSAEAFMNYLISSLRQDQMATFRERYRRLDMLILDDVQFLAGKERTQEEFFHTFNALQADGKQIVLTSDKPPGDLAGLEQNLRSRFAGGLIADVHPPSLSTRIEILERKATAQAIRLPAEVARYLAASAGPSVRELEGALTRVMAAAAVHVEGITLELAQRVVPPSQADLMPVSVEAVLRCVSAEFRVGVADLRSHRRSKSLSYARQVAMYLCRKLAAVSFPKIGDELGGRDHSTVMHAVKAVERMRGADPATASLLTRLEARLSSPRASDRASGEKQSALHSVKR